MGMISRQYSPPQAEQNCASEGNHSESDIIGSSDVARGYRPTPMEELEKSSVLEMVEDPPQVTPRLHGRCRRSTLGALSCASTVSGASSPLALESVQLSPYLAPQEPVHAAALAAA
eukprot:CAMPEP_0169175488 /NCGR_PEP_ID=MMETSP1015-20121227/65279_1 /TAXON_ID=342587 /ORGANISM="Karlodinium micrum, Strain CCMP2283" /LENGTH=115 /DNA_ID=CAMNT_0009249763 /DNA_START=63 /DNA_END=406 /DNA_ORIENTATION=+